MDMKNGCQRCETKLAENASAFICSYECTFCETCFSSLSGICPNCSGELVSRPKRGKRLRNHHIALDVATSAAKKWIDGLDERSVGGTVGHVILKERFERSLPKKGKCAEGVIQDLIEVTDGGLLGSASGRFFAWVIGGALPSSLAADWLVSTWDQNAALFACGPSAAVVEEVTGEWIKELLDLPRDASFAFTTGCQLAHVTCLAAARGAVLERANWDVNKNGLFQAPRIKILAGEHSHGSIYRAIRFLGMGKESLVSLPNDSLGQLDKESLVNALTTNPDCPTIVVLNAAD
ncbi:MAG: DUF1272 domain-containing protein, partial [Proteobacteria bacterium]|nr:DUF1272 domain-containing protein [Pseudomonadota bacterium]